MAGDPFQLRDFLDRVALHIGIPEHPCGLATHPDFLPPNDLFYLFPDTEEFHSVLGDFRPQPAGEVHHVPLTVVFTIPEHLGVFPTGGFRQRLLPFSFSPGSPELSFYRLRSSVADLGEPVTDGEHHDLGVGDFVPVFQATSEGIIGDELQKAALNVILDSAVGSGDWEFAGQGDSQPRHQRTFQATRFSEPLGQKLAGGVGLILLALRLLGCPHSLCGETPETHFRSSNDQRFFYFVVDHVESSPSPAIQSFRVLAPIHVPTLLRGAVPGQVVDVVPCFSESSLDNRLVRHEHPGLEIRGHPQCA